jgi:ribonuclease III
MDPLIILRSNREEIEKKIGYSFKDHKLMELAFTHKSYFVENEGVLAGHNERIEFLGDAVLQLLSSSHLYKNYPQMNEGELSQYRSRLVDTEALTLYSEKIGISEFLVLGKGERRQEKRSSLLANLFEAVLGAIYLDGGIESASAFFLSLIQEMIQNIIGKPCQSLKSLLQEWAQKTHLVLPEYFVVEESGPDHKRFFRVEVKLLDESIGVGEGFSKKEAERNAAEDALKKIGPPA